MHFPLTVALRPARGVLAPVLAAHVAAALALFYALLPMPIAGGAGAARTVAVVAGGVVLALSLRAALRREFAKRAVILVLRDDGALAVERDGRVEVFRLADTMVDFGWAAWLPLRRDALPAGRIVWRLMLVPANLPPGRWRMLRVWLRHKAWRPGGD